jgi:two-component sensor histidine kinase
VYAGHTDRRGFFDYYYRKKDATIEKLLRLRPVATSLLQNNNSSKHPNERPITLQIVRRTTIGIAVLWTVLTAVVIGYELRSASREAEQAATIAAREQFIKDVIYRHWNAALGGVYAPISEHLRPNPYLTLIEERDIETTTGRKLTLINPAYMTRMVHELGLEMEGVRGHITSLKPIRPKNAPDGWESQALRSFSSPHDEVTSIKHIDGEPHLRLMRPILTEEACLTCHAQQGYELGDIRGGISVTVPMRPYLDITRSDALRSSAGFGIIWFLGFGVIVFGGRHIGVRVNEQLAAESRVRKLLCEKEMMLREVQHRIKNNMSMMSSLLNLKAASAIDKEVKDALQEISDRFGVMQILYDKLYKADDLEHISLAEYIPEIIEAILSGYAHETDISVHTNIEDIASDPKTLSALGILTAELITNALKYAFPQEERGTVRVEAQQADGQIRFTVSDDGAGIPEHIDFDSTSGLGLQLVYHLALQIDGTASIERENGTTVEIIYPAAG